MIKKIVAIKIQGGVPSYARYAIEKLIGIKGENTSDVLSFIINIWIAMSQSELDRTGITVEGWRKEEGKKR